VPRVVAALVVGVEPAALEQGGVARVYSLCDARSYRCLRGGMKLLFDSDLGYQARAVGAVCGLFRGAAVKPSKGEFTRASRLDDLALDVRDNDFWVVNHCTVPREEILRNVQEIQVR